jgi:hypothetical protein
MKTNERPYNDPALREALRKDCSQENMLTDDFEQQVMMKITMHQRRKPYFRIVATFIGLLMLSGLAFAAYHFAVGEGLESPSQEAKASVLSQQKPAEINDHIMLFDNMQLDSVLTIVAQHYQKQVKYQNDYVRHLHFHIEWNQAAPLADFITLINNFEGISLREENDTIIAE